MSSLTTACSMERESSAVDEFGTRLSLAIGGGAPPARRKTVQLFGEVFSPQESGGDGEMTAAPATRKKREGGGASTDANGCGAGRRNKRARTAFQGEQDVDRRSPSGGGAGGEGSGRKKLRLSSAQAKLLEDSFRAHNILSHGEKQELARRAGLSARQVEVWFQNRRARTKLKQTELDCGLLRRWCDRLADENVRLRRDLADLRAAAASVVCPACCDKKLAVVDAGDMA
ncbi:hypothetical protein ACP4OV_009696 [Aristida adscensionis]